MSYSKDDYKAMAKAGGITLKEYKQFEHSGFRDTGSYGLFLEGASPFGGDKPWNPTTNDADCFRLMVDAGMEVDTELKDEVRVFKNIMDIPELLEISAIYSDHPDKAAATRKAICDCAIEIGRAV